jgi:membrane protease YdiL (CAAX protease family)
MFFYIKFIIIFILITIGIKIVTKIIIFNDVDYNIIDSKKSAKISLLVAVVEIIITTIYLIIIKSFFMYASQIEGLILLTMNYLIQIFVVIAVIKIRKETLSSLGITKNNLLKSIITGILISLVYYILIRSLFKNKLMDITSLKSCILFINYTVVGFSEEIIFRGYLQGRLTSWLGTIKGLFITSIIFSFFHLPNRLIFGEASFLSAAMNCILLLPISMLLGYIFIKTKSIFTGSIFHTFNDWIQNVVNIIG